MFVRNWYKMIAALMFDIVGEYPVNTYGKVTEKFAFNNSNYPHLGIYNGNTPYIGRINTGNYYQVGVILGSGNTPVSLDDYKLSGSIISGISASASVKSKETENGRRCTAVYTITNNNANEITIQEVGVFGNSAYQGDTIMLERSVLDSPVTIQPNGVGQVVYHIDMNFPTA